ncbi:unnamed protein product [Lota lota]
MVSRITFQTLITFQGEASNTNLRGNVTSTQPIRAASTKPAVLGFGTRDGSMQVLHIKHLEQVYTGCPPTVGVSNPGV